MSKPAVFVLERIFDASPELVWRGWTEPELFSVWYGPNIETIVHRMDIEPGGEVLVEMKAGGNSMYQRADVTEVEPHRRLAWVQSMTDANWQAMSDPNMPGWPRALLATVTFEPDGEKTKLRLTWSPHNATEAELAGFAAAMDGMGSGWNAGMELLAKLLAELER